MLDAVAQAGVEEAVFFHGAALQAKALEPRDAGNAEGALWGGELVFGGDRDVEVEEEEGGERTDCFPHGDGFDGDVEDG